MGFETITIAQALVMIPVEIFTGILILGILFGGKKDD